MAEIKNEPKLQDDVTKGLRNICERRAATISYMLDEARKRGLDDSFAREAIYNYGKDLGEAMHRSMDDPSNMEEFAKNFAAPPHNDIYEMELVELNDDQLYIDFHYCPYVEEWVKQGRSLEELDNLCDLAMEGDRAIGQVFSDFEFKLGRTIAQGHHVCEIRFDRSDK